MIVDKRTYDPTTPTDAPPSYDSLQEVHLELKEKPKSDGSSSSLSQPVTVSSESFGSPELKKKNRFKPSKNWFNFSASNARTSREVHTTVLRLISRTRQGSHLEHTCRYWHPQELCGCVCAKHNMQLSELLQQKYIEDHTPLYWVIVKRLPDGHPQPENTQGPDLLSAFIELRLSSEKKKRR